MKVARAARLAYEGATRTAFRLGYFAALGPPGLESRLLRQILATTSEEIRAAAVSTFQESGRTVVRYLPNGGDADA